MYMYNVCIYMYEYTVQCIYSEFTMAHIQYMYMYILYTSGLLPVRNLQIWKLKLVVLVYM